MGVYSQLTEDTEMLSAEEKKLKLFLQQKNTLDTFLAHSAITRAQYDKSLGNLMIKMGIQEERF